ncbi:hypothetical protein [Streptomyces sp. NPDC002215]|uniref:hypothetical protein n=1 Tax=Streptomyces sp. NPDC002215 TaxID=3154412 RepID=UPI0033284FC3
MDNSLWSVVISTSGVLAGVALGSWTTALRERGHRVLERNQQLLDAEKDLCADFLMVVSEVQPATNSMVNRHLRGDHEGVMLAIDRYLANRQELRRCVAEIQLLAPEGLELHAQQVLATAEEEFEAALNSFAHAADSFRIVAKRRLAIG